MGVKIDIFGAERIWSYSGSLADSASLSSGSWPCAGYSEVVGMIVTDKASDNASGIQILQSPNFGQDFYETASSGISASSTEGFSFHIFGDVLELDYHNGNQDTLELKLVFYMKPQGEALW